MKVSENGGTPSSHPFYRLDFHGFSMKASSYTPMTKRKSPYYNVFPVLSVTLSGQKIQEELVWKAIFDRKVGPQTIAKLVFLGNRLTMVLMVDIYTNIFNILQLIVFIRQLLVAGGYHFLQAKEVARRVPSASEGMFGSVFSHVCVMLSIICIIIYNIYNYIYILRISQKYLYRIYIYIYISIESLTHVSVLYT